MRATVLAVLLATALAMPASRAPAAEQTGARAGGQAALTISGRVTDDTGRPLPNVSVLVQGLGVGAQTGSDGRFVFAVPESRATGQSVVLTARVLGYGSQSATVTLAPGRNVVHDFTLTATTLQLSAVVVTGAGTSTTREKLATSVSSVDSSIIRRQTTPQNVVGALAAVVPGVEVRTASAEPGSSVSIKIRGASTLSGTAQPLFVIDGQPIDNSAITNGSSFATSNGAVSASNRAADINPNDIESIDILKGAAAASIYGARASNGVVLITTKRGRAGPTRVTFATTETADRPVLKPLVQRVYGQGDGGNPVAAGCGVTSANCTLNLFGPKLADGTPTYDHLGEIFRTGYTSDNNVSVSGGSDRTTFFASGGFTSQNGITVGPTNKYNRATVRVKGSQQLTSTLNVGGNLTYTDARGNYQQAGDNPAGLMLNGLRTAPEYDNTVVYSPTTGLERTYRMPNPALGTDTISRGYNNPFWAAENYLARVELGRSIGEVNADWRPFGWLQVKENFGADSYTNAQLVGQPFSGSIVPVGAVTQDNLNYLEIDHNLVATATANVSRNLTNILTAGQNLNSRRIRESTLNGNHLVAPQPFAIQNTVTINARNADALAHIQGYFVQDEVDLFEQLYLTAGVRSDGYSTFGAAKRTALYPKASAAWELSRFLGNVERKGYLSYTKLRAAYGETGKEPPVYAAVSSLSNSTTFVGTVGNDPIGLNLSGRPGLTSNNLVGNPNLRPERQRETEVGADVGVLDQRADFSVTVYRKRASDVILPITVNAASNGATQQYKNAASITNRGVEASLNVRPYTSPRVEWNAGVTYTRNRGEVTSLAGARIYLLNSFEGDVGGRGAAVVGYAPGVLVGSDFARCGRGLVIAGVGDVDALCAATAGGFKPGALFITARGTPVADPTTRVLADPHPDYTMGYNTSVRLWRRLQLSTLFDVRHGGRMYNATRAGLNSNGASIMSTQRNFDAVFGKNYLTDVYPDVAGPGVGVVGISSPAQWQAWYSSVLYNRGVTSAFMEDAGFTKWRELSASYTLGGRLVRRTGFSTADLRVAGRNLHTWTKYTGLDPEGSIGGATQLTQGVDFMNLPQARSLVLSLTLNR